MGNVIKKIAKTLLLFLVILVLLLSALTGYVFWDNSRVVTNRQVLTFRGLPQAFDDTIIALITDFHNSGNYQKVIENVKAANPSYIFIAGDLVSMDTTDFHNTEALLKGLVEIAPVYYAYGNHEIWSQNEDDGTIAVGDLARSLGVNVLNDEVVPLEKDGEMINVVGIRDLPYPDGDDHYTDHMMEKVNQLALKLDPNTFTIGLFHRANQADLLEELPCNLILSGHTHGGHVNLPGIQDKILETHMGGEVKYVKGLYKLSDRQIMVSSGVGVEDNLPRVFNTPEVVVIRLNLAWKDGRP